MRYITRLLAAAALPALLSACSGPSIWVPIAQTNYAFPNSNVVPVGTAKATATRSYVVPFQTPRFADAVAYAQLRDQALKSKNADILVDAEYHATTTIVPLYIVNIWTVNETLEGTAAKMEIGKRDLR
ncbi:MAG: hypothetical protein ABT940_09250 [Alphaproteobacteria bacterium]